MVPTFWQTSFLASCVRSWFNLLTEACICWWNVENAGAMRDWIARRELQNIDQYISRGSDPAAVSFLQSTLKALQEKVITEATAMASVSNESELRRAIRGIG